MAVIKSGASTDQLTIGAVNKAARVELFDAAGNPILSGGNLLTKSVMPQYADAGNSATRTSANAASTATVLAYTANPTVGTLVGNLRTVKLFASTTATDSDTQIVTFGDRPGQAIVLRGTSEVFAINLNSVTVTGNSSNIYIEYTEE